MHSLSFFLSLSLSLSQCALLLKTQCMSRTAQMHLLYCACLQALFGEPKYGKIIRGSLYVPTSDELACNGLPPSPSGTGHIFLIKRGISLPCVRTKAEMELSAGECSFVAKVRARVVSQPLYTTTTQVSLTHTHTHTHSRSFEG